MCVGPELALALTAAAGASAGGNYLQTEQNNASLKAQQNAKNEAAAEGVAQQQENQKQATGVLNNTIQQFSAPQQASDLGSLITNRTNAINSNTTPGPAAASNIKSAPQVIQSDLASKLAGVTAYGAQQAGALGAMGATNDQAVNNNITLDNSGMQLGTISNTAAHQLAVNKVAQNAAYNNARKAPSTLGSILSTIGSFGQKAAFAAATPGAPDPALQTPYATITPAQANGGGLM